MKIKPTEKILLGISLMGLLISILIAELPLETWPYLLAISFLLSIVLSALLQKAWRYRAQRNSEKKVKLKIDNIKNKTKKYLLFLNLINEGVIIINQENICVYANKTAHSITGLNEKELLNHKISKIIPFEIPKDNQSFESVIWQPNGEKIPVLLSFKKLKQQSQTTQETLVCINSLQEIKELETKLEQSQNISMASFQTSKLAIIIIDSNQKTIINANQSACDLIGYRHNNLIGKPIENFLKFDTINHEEFLINHEDKLIPIIKISTDSIIKGRPYSFETIIDISERKKAEEILLKKQRMDSLTTLTSGIAHEFNNINNITSGAISLLLQEDIFGQIPSAIQDNLQTIKKMIDRGAILTHDLMIFTSKKADYYEYFNLSELLEECIYDFHTEIEDLNINLDIKIPEKIIIYADKKEIKRVLDNIISNACDALLIKKEGVIKISWEEDANSIYLFIQDNGCGIKKEHIEKVFDPFYSTKGVYAATGSEESAIEGRGLGLSVCHTIMEKHHNGKINIISQHLKGTTVTLSFPKPEAQDD